MAVGQRCPLGSPFHLETFNLKKQNKGHEHTALAIVSVYCFLRPPSRAVLRERRGARSLHGRDEPCKGPLPHTGALRLLGPLSSAPGELRNLLGLDHIRILIAPVFPTRFIALILLNSFGPLGGRSKLGCYV